MSDPRGRGFRRGKGRWHAPQGQPPAPVNPVNLGWTQVDSENRWYIGNQFLELAPDGSGFMLIQEAMIAGIKRFSKFLIPPGLLARETNSILKDEAGNG